MSEDPATRRARLAALREAAGGEAAAPAPAPAAGAPVLKFRNYHADEAALPPGSHAVVEAAKAPELAVAVPAPRTVVPDGAPDEVRKKGEGEIILSPPPPSPPLGTT